MIQSFDAYVTAALFDRLGKAVFVLGDGTVRFEDGATVEAHDGASLCACLHPSGLGVISGGDELSDLAEAFNQMTATLKDNQARLAARMKEIVAPHTFTSRAGATARFW